LSQKATFRANGAERLRLSRRRAGIVRQYVVGKNEVVLKNVAFMGVGGSLTSPTKSAADMWRRRCFSNVLSVRSWMPPTDKRGTYFGSQ
jgi:hypothetical protein